MSPVEQPAVALAAMLDGFRLPQCIHVACALGIPDLVPDVPDHAASATEALARAAGVQPGPLRRLLRALSTAGVFMPAPPDSWRHSPMSRPLRRDAPEGLHARAMALGALAWAPWGQLEGAVRTGAPAFDAVFGTPLFEHLSTHPELGALFGQTMSSWTQRTASDVLSVFSFDDYAHVADLGGGHGILLDAVLSATPSLRATLLDRPEVIDLGAPALRPDNAGRCTLQALDMFDDPLPHADAYVLSWVLHDWEDDACVTLLSACLKSNPAADLVVIEMLLEEPELGPAAAWFDLEMLVQTGGRERTRAEYQALFARAGRRNLQVHVTGGTHAVLCSRGRG